MERARTRARKGREEMGGNRIEVKGAEGGREREGMGRRDRRELKEVGPQF
jgi:hypothetical protein